ncbi:Uncharacterised protein [Mycobacteroides abscessus subsp. abscessus]|nr:Uncharacterised protein [Mycobacteroides abscessus subsp. abscessus]
MQGTLLLVQSERRGSSLRSWLGTVLTVDSGADFADEGGSFTVAEDPTVYTYTGVSRSDVDESAELLGVQSRTVTFGFVAVHPEQVDVWAEVEVAGAAGAVQALVPHELRPLLADGAHGMSVTIERVGEVWQVADVLGQRAEIESGAIVGLDDALAEASNTAMAAVISANGKNSRTRSLNPPSEADAVGRVDGDTWWQLDSFSANNAIGQWVLADGAWVLENFKSEVIANLDVSKLTATTATMDVVAARKMVSDFGSFKLLTAERLVIAADNMVPNGSLEFGDSRGWDPVYTYSTDAPTGYPGSVWRKGGTTFVGLPDIPVTPGVDYLFEVWVKADKAGSVLYMEVRDRPGANLSLGFYEIGSSTRKSRPIEGWPVPTEWTKVTRVLRVPEGVHTIYMDKFFFNHGSGTVSDATVFIAGMRMRAMTGADLVVDGAIDGKVITGATVQTAKTGARVVMNTTGIRAWDASGNQTVHINGTSNTMVGEFRTNRPGAGPGVVLVNTTSAGAIPGIWFSSTAQTLGTDAAIYTDNNNRLIIRGNTSGGVQPVWFPGSVEAYQYVGVKDSVNGTARAILDVSGAGRTGRVVADAAVFDNLSTRSGSKVDVWNHLSLQYITTVSLASNMFIDANQLIYKIGSARKLKINIQDQATEFDPWALLNVPARIWSDRAEVEARRDKMNGVENTLGVEAYGRIPGVVAEEVADAGLHQFVTRNPDTGEVEGVMYDRLWTPLIPIVKDLLARVEALERPTVIEGEVA